jgi:hypothetical protein
VGEVHKKGVAGNVGLDYWKPAVKCKHPKATHKPYEGKTKPKTCPLSESWADKNASQEKMKWRKKNERNNSIKQ